MKKLVVGLAAGALLLAGCGSGGGSSAGSAPSSAPVAPAGSSSAPKITASGKVAVLYAGSLANLMEQSVGPAFDQTTGGQFQGTGAGSTALVSDIKGKVKQGDVFISASTSANTPLMGAANGDWEDWYATFATAPLVIGYNPNSKFVSDLKSKPWQQVITESGFKMGSTDPKLDPKGKLAASALKQAGIPAGKVQVFPEEQLLGRLQAGQLDAGFFYTSEAADGKLATIPLGADYQLSATYTATVLNNAANEQGGEAFLEYLFSPAGTALMKQHGLQLQTISVTGDKTKVPSDLDTVLGVG
ncbi:MAG TPA: substrate-binding domain-containing protein [Pseudonocardiaceae bacterium]|nr:substrate-binding domain-containing protein [Pseudonocardiaceae bacterium]